MNDRRIVVGISGASGFQYGARALELLRGQDLEIHLVISAGAERTCALETSLSIEAVKQLADVVHPIGDLGASISSGSFRTTGMLVAPCSMRSLSAIANACADNLLTRAADVTLKERRPLVLMVREAPLNLAHLRNMEAVTQMGGIIFPPVPAMYQKPATLEEIVTHSVGRALGLLGIRLPQIPRWGETIPG